MDIVTWFELNVLYIFVASCATLIILLLLRKLGFEDRIDKVSEKIAQKQTDKHITANPEKETEKDILFESHASHYKTVFDAPFAILSVLSLITLILSLAVIWTKSRGEEIATADVILNWLGTNGVVLLVITVVAYLLTAMIKVIIPKFVVNLLASRSKRLKKKTDEDEEFAKRGRTISNVLVSTINAIVWVVTIFIILSSVGLDITPLLASAGVVGIAISLGAQSLIKDIISGFFILLEGHYNEGDYITVAGISGTVKDINFRRTTVRSTDGILYSIPNGQISIAANYTNETSKVYFEVPVSYDTDLDLAEKVINATGIELFHDSIFGKSIKKPIKFIRVNKFDNSSINLLVSGDTKPGIQWTIAGVFRKRLKKAFDEAGISIPYNHTNVIIEGNPDASAINVAFNKCPHCGKSIDIEHNTEEEEER